MTSLTRVMGFGTFDGIHPGHRAFLRQLRDLGGELVVVVARDQNVAKLKGRLPERNEEARRQELEATGLTDQVILGHPTDFYQCLLDHQPKVIGLGYDQKANTAEIQKRLPEVKIMRLKAFQPTRYKSSILACR